MITTYVLGSFQGGPDSPHDTPPHVVILDEGVPPDGGRGSPGFGEHRGGAVLLTAITARFKFFRIRTDGAQGN